MLSLGTVLVIGGSSGIGFSTAEAALESGARVVISSSNNSRLQDATAKLSKAHSGRVFSHACDLSDVNTQEANMTSLLKYCTSAAVTGTDNGKLSHIAFTAGDPIKSVPLTSFDPRNALTMAPLRYIGAITLAKLAPAYLVPGPESSITYTSGTSAAKPTRGTSTWIGLGAAVEATMLALALELAPIRVNVVSPGAIETPLLRGMGAHIGAGDSEEARTKSFLEMVAGDTMLGRVGQPEETAQAYLYFMKDKFQTGTVLRTDGGRLLK